MYIHVVTREAICECDVIYIYHSMRYLFGIYKELIKCGLQSNSDKIVLYRSIYGISSELDITRIYMNTVK